VLGSADGVHEQRLKRVLGDELVRLRRQGTVVALRHHLLHLGHRRVSVVDEWRVAQIAIADEDVHRHVVVEPSRPNPIGEAEPAVVLHRPRVAPLHLRQLARSRSFVDHAAVHAQLVELEGKGQPHRTTTDDEDVDVVSAHRYAPVAEVLVGAGKPRSRETFPW
jgi:hypothetical protein